MDGEDSLGAAATIETAALLLKSALLAVTLATYCPPAVKPLKEYWVGKTSLGDTHSTATIADEPVRDPPVAATAPCDNPVETRSDLYCIPEKVTVHDEP